MSSSSHSEKALRRAATASEAAAMLSQSTYSGTVEAVPVAPNLKMLRSATEAAMELSQSTYSGTVEGISPPASV